jgi:hypothetical protein
MAAASIESEFFVTSCTDIAGEHTCTVKPSFNEAVWFTCVTADYLFFDPYAYRKYMYHISYRHQGRDLHTSSSVSPCTNSFGTSPSRSAGTPLPYFPPVPSIIQS